MIIGLKTVNTDVYNLWIGVNRRELEQIKNKPEQKPDFFGLRVNLMLWDGKSFPAGKWLKRFVKVGIKPVQAY